MPDSRTLARLEAFEEKYGTHDELLDEYSRATVELEMLLPDQLKSMLSDTLSKLHKLHRHSALVSAFVAESMYHEKIKKYTIFQS